MGASVTATTWGPWDALRIADERVSATVVPQVGGRVVSLRDLGTGREWLTQGEPPDRVALGRWAAEEATYGGRESFGWDECLPSVARCPDPLRPEALPLRDHGDQWGRRCEVTVDAAEASVTTSWPSPRWPITFARRLSLPGAGVLRAEYAVTSHTGTPVPVLWAAHPALQLEPGTSLELSGVTHVRVVGVLGWPIEPGEQVPWPLAAPGQDLSRIRSIDSGGAAKLYARATLARTRAPDGSSLTVEADGELVRTMGVWLDAGGWPPDGTPIHQTALEPTSSPDDHVADALTHGRAWVVPAGGSLRWWMSFRVEGSDRSQAGAKV